MEAPCRFSQVFVQCFVAAQIPKKADGTLFYDRLQQGDVATALKFLEIGGPMPAKMNDDTAYDGRYVRKEEWSVLKAVRVGDWASTTGHCFMVGDTRYTLKFGGKTRYLNQSGLISAFVGKKYDL